MSQKIAIIDYNIGNLASVENAFTKLGQKTQLESDPQNFKNYDKIILPGVGAYGDAMDHLKKYEMIEALKEYAKSGNYMMGICLGMQLLFESSQEFGHSDGLGLIEGSVEKFDSERFQENLKVPQMGWNTIKTQEHSLFKEIPQESYFYFVHTYHAVCKNVEDVIGVSDYGYEFASIVARENVLGIQPHPEKSHKQGLQLLNNFIQL